MSRRSGEREKKAKLGAVETSGMRHYCGTSILRVRIPLASWARIRRVCRITCFLCWRRSPWASERSFWFLETVCVVPLSHLQWIDIISNPKLTSTDYASKDGTAIRDYIHIQDLARGHLLALNYLRDNRPGVKAWNLGTGKGSTVFEMIKAFNEAVGRSLPYQVVGRRQGDVLNLTANPSLANKELGWKAEKTLEEACQDLWRWTENNPQGYRQKPPQEFVEQVSKNRK